MKAWVLFLAPVALLAACATPASVPFAAAHSEEAQVRWQKAASSVVCEAVFARASDGAVRAQFYKGSAKVLLALTLEKNGSFQARGALAGRGWSGNAADAPHPLVAWASVMQIFQAAGSWTDGEREVHSGNTRAAVVISHGRLQSLNVINDLNGEVISASFASAKSN